MSERDPLTAEPIAEDRNPLVSARLTTKLFSLTFGSCTCMTKTPDTKYHDDACAFRILQEAAMHVHKLQSQLLTAKEALQFYADRHHCVVDDNAWDTVSGEPQNFLCDEAGTATIEDGSIAKQAMDRIAETDK